MLSLLCLLLAAAFCLVCLCCLLWLAALVFRAVLDTIREGWATQLELRDRVRQNHERAKRAVVTGQGVSQWRP
jgi:hypothetical protein